MTFKKIAHSIPELMGNQNLISNSECDSCNVLFSKYEDAMAKFLGIARTLGAAKGKQGIPTFKNPDKKLEARKNGSKPGILINFDSLDPNYYEIDESKKKFTIKATRHPYKPLNVYKCLLKVLFSLLHENVLPHYEANRRILLSDEYDEKLKGNPYFRLFGFFCPGPQFSSPLAMIWKKKEEARFKNIPTRTMTIHFQNYMYQIFLPYGTDDTEINEVGKTITFPFIPPFVEESQIELFGKPIALNIDLSHNEIKKGDKQEVTMSFSENIFNSFPI